MTSLSLLAGRTVVQNMQCKYTNYCKALLEDVDALHKIQRILSECLLISRLPGKASRTFVDIASQFTSWFTFQTSDYDVIIAYRVDSMSLTT